MSFILGLDAGGTYTDSVIFDSKYQKIIGASRQKVERGFYHFQKSPILGEGFLMVGILLLTPR